MTATDSLTCEWCRSEPASHLIVYDVGVRDCRAPIRVKAVIGGDCSRANEGRAEQIAASLSSVWLYALTPAKDSVDA